MRLRTGAEIEMHKKNYGYQRMGITGKERRKRGKKINGGDVVWGTGGKKGVNEGKGGEVKGKWKVRNRKERRGQDRIGEQERRKVEEREEKGKEGERGESGEDKGGNHMENKWALNFSAHIYMFPINIA